MDDDTNLAEWGASQIAGGAFASVGAGLFGFGLSALGVGFPSADSSAIAEMNSKLQYIESQLTGLSNDMSQMRLQLAQNEYDTRCVILNAIIDPIKELSTNLTDALSGDLTGKTADKEDIMGRIYGDLVDKLSTIHQGVTGPDTNGVSLYELLSQLLKGNHRFLSASDTSAMKTQLNYFQSMQFTQLWLVVEYYNAHGDSQSMIGDATNEFQQNLTSEQTTFQVNRIWEGTVIDQGSGLMIYVGDCPYVDFKSVEGVLSGMNERYAGDVQGWRLPTVAEILGDDRTTGLFRGRDGIPGYDSKAGTPTQWLQNQGVPNDMTGIHFWTSNEVPAPDPSDDQYQYHDDGIAPPDRDYDADLQAWKDAGPPHYCVDSKTLNYFQVNEPDQAHVVAVKDPADWQRQLLMPK